MENVRQEAVINGWSSREAVIPEGQSIHTSKFLRQRRTQIWQVERRQKCSSHDSHRNIYSRPYSQAYSSYYASASRIHREKEAVL